jgi:hypothetical protein
MAGSTDLISMLGACISALSRGQMPDTAILTFLLSKVRADRHGVIHLRVKAHGVDHLLISCLLLEIFRL